MTGEPMVRDVLLRDGSTLRLRSPVPSDARDIKGLYDSLSAENRYLRFHGHGATDAPARADAEADGDARVVLVGRHDGRVVAVAGYDRLREPGAAEVAFTVADDFHGRGIATRMLEQLAVLAAEQGIERFDAEVMADNRGMLTVFKRAGFGLRRKGAGGEVVLALDIRPSEAVRERIAERDHRAVVASLRPILSPGSVAVVAAGTEPGSLGVSVLNNLIEGGFLGVVTPVSPAAGVLRSMRVAPSLDELETAPELVVIAAPPGDVLEIAREAVHKGAKALLVVSGGFADAGEEGRAREERLLEVVREAGVRMVGPNCLGVLNTDPGVSLNATAAGASVPAGRLAISSQSGAIGIALLGHAAARRLGISSFASLGNRADVSTNDLLEYWEEDDRTAAVMLYLESFGNPERFSRISRRVSRRKPILAVKGRRATVSPATAQSHTAAALQGDAVVDAVLREAGVLRFRTGEELFNAAQFFETQPLPHGRRVAIVSNSAGAATLAADACATRGLVVGELDAGTRQRLTRQLGGSERVGNPLDLGIHATAEAYAGATRELLDDEGIDAVMAYCIDLAGGDPGAVLSAVSQVAREQAKPVVASMAQADGQLPEARRAVPNFLFPEACAGVLARAAERREWLSRPLGQQPALEGADPASARDLVAARLGDDATAPGGWLSPTAAEVVLAAQGIAHAPVRRCPDVEAAVAAASAIAGPIALKADFPPPAHSGDVDAGLLGLEGEVAVRAGWKELECRVQAAGRDWLGAIVQPLVGPGADVLVGALSDPELGTVMGVGLGGRQAGLAHDVAFRLLPVTDVDADELIAASRGVALQLGGFRGGAVLDRAALRDLVLRFAGLLRAVPEIVEADLNPVRCMVSGAAVLDMRLRAQRRARPDRIKTW